MTTPLTAAATRARIERCAAIVYRSKPCVDLLGIARAMYAARKREGDLAALPELAEIGKKLTLALKLGRGDPDTMGHRAAWGHAEEATSRLMKLITASTPAAPIVEAAATRLRRLGPQASTDRDAKRAATKARN